VRLWLEIVNDQVLERFASLRSYASQLSLSLRQEALSTAIHSNPQGRHTKELTSNQLKLHCNQLEASSVQLQAIYI
jgi:hypothetical protein